MNKTIIAIMVMILLWIGAVPVSASSSDLALAKQWANDHYTQHTVKTVKFRKVGNNPDIIYIEQVKTKSLGKNKGKVIGTRYTVKYPKKVRKGKKVTVYMVYDTDLEIEAMVCLGVVKADKDRKVDCPCCQGQDRDCPYWLHDECRHMTEDEIEDFEWSEWHYQDEDGNWIER